MERDERQRQRSGARERSFQSEGLAAAPGRRTLTDGLRGRPTDPAEAAELFGRTLEVANGRVIELRRAIEAADSGQALEAAAPLRTAIELAREHAAGDPDRRRALAEILEVAEVLLARAPRPSKKAVAGGVLGSWDLWNREMAAWRSTLLVEHDAADQDKDAPDQRLPDGVRGDLESATGQSLGHVKVRADEGGAKVATAHDARAVAIGNEIHFGEGQLDATTPTGRELIAHEVAHVVQAEAGSVNADLAMDEGPEAAEAEADGFASQFRESGGARSWRPSIAVSRSAPMRAPATPPAGRSTALVIPDALHLAPGDTDIAKAQGAQPASGDDDKKPTASRAAIGHYLARNTVPAWLAIKTYLESVPWAASSPRLEWSDRVFIAATYEGLRKAIDNFDVEPLAEVLYPHDPIAAVTPYIATKVWAPGVGLVLAQLFHGVLATSVRRMTARYVDVADAQMAATPAAVATVELGQLVTSHPMDRFVAFGLTFPGVARVAASNEPGDKRAVPRTGLRPVTTSWEGARDPRLWNFVRAEPADATPEEVAASLFAYARGRYHGNATSFFAYGLACAAPLFGLPTAWAAQFPDALENAPQAIKDGHLPDPASDSLNARMLLLASTDTSDAIAVAQAAHDPRVLGMSRAAVSSTLGDCLIQLAYLRTVLASWDLGGEIVTETLHISGKRDELAHAPDDRVAAWAPIALGQRDRLLRIAKAAQSITAGAGSLHVADKRSKGAAPLREILALLADAAATSHLAKTSDQLFEAAQNEQAGLSLHALQANLVELEGSFEQVHSAAGSDKQNRDEASRFNETKDAARRIETRMLSGEQVGAEELEGVQITAQEMSLRARLHTLQVEIGDVETAARKAGVGPMSHVMATKNFIDLDGAASFVHQAIGEVYDDLNADRTRAKPLQGDADGLAPLSPGLAARKHAVSRAQQRFAKLADEQDLGHFLKNAYDTISSQELRTAIASAAVTIGFGILVGGVTSWVAKGLTETYLAAESVETIAALSEEARLSLKIATLTTDVTGNAIGQQLVTGEPLSKALVDNAAFILGTSGTLGAIEHDLQGASAFEKTLTSQLAKIDAQEARAALAMDTLAKTGRLAGWVAKQAGAVTAHTVMGMAIGSMLAHLEGETAGAQSEAMIIQGASVALGRLTHAAIGERMPSYMKLLQLERNARTQRLYAEAQQLQQLAAAVAAKPEIQATLDLLHARTQVLEHELEILEDLVRKPVHGGPSPHEIADMQADLKAQLGDVRSQAMLDVTWQLLGLHELAPGVWSGSPEHLVAAAEEARKAGHRVEPVTDAGDGVTRLAIDGQAVELHPAAHTETNDRQHEPPPPEHATREPDGRAQHDTNGEINASMVQGSEFIGHGRATAAPAEILRVAQQELSEQDFAGEIPGVRQIVLQENGAYRVEMDGGAAFDLRVTTTQLGPTKVARSFANTERAVHNVQLNDRVASNNIRRALAHEIAELAREHRQSLAGEVPARRDVLTAGRSVEPGATLSNHDGGRVAELNVLAGQLGRASAAGEATEVARLRGEIGALVERLGLREGTGGASERLALIRDQLTDAAHAALGDIGRPRGDLPEPDRVALDRFEARSREQQGVVATQAGRERELHPAGASIVSDRPDGRVSLDRIQQMNTQAIAARSQKSIQTLQELRSLQPSAGEPYARAPRHVQIGGGAGVAGLTPETLYIDARGRWHVDRSGSIAQTAGQLGEMLGLGNAHLFADANERVSLEAIRFMINNAAAQARCIDGYGSVKTEDGRAILEIRPDDGGAPIKLLLDLGSPVVFSMGFPVERAPRPWSGAVEPTIAVGRVRKRLGDLGVAPPPHLAALAGANDADAAAWATYLKTEADDPAHPGSRTTLAELLGRGGANDIIEALTTLECADAWNVARLANGPAQGRSAPTVLRGDEATEVDFSRHPNTNWIVTGLGGTAISAAEAIMRQTERRLDPSSVEGPGPVTVVMVGKVNSQSLQSNTQWRQVNERYGPHGERRLRLEDADLGGIRADGTGGFVINQGGPGEVHAHGYIAAMGRDGQIPPAIADVVSAAIQRDPTSVHGELLFDPADNQYLGYRIQTS